MITRRYFNGLTVKGLAAAAVGAVALASLSIVGAGQARAATIGADGLMTEPWFVNSFLILKEDLEEAAAAGKRLAVIFSLEGCPYCREMHEVNFARSDITEFVKTNFNVLQLNIIGARMVTDFDGEAMEERALGRKWLVNFTPTLVFFPNDPAAVAGKSGRAAEATRIQGYLSPFYFYHFFEWVRSGTYKEEGFQRYANARLDEMRAKGESIEDWRLG